MRRIGSVVSVVLLAAVLTMGAWAGSETKGSEAKGSEMKAPAGEPIKIGALFAVTGGAAWLGEPEKNTALMLADTINAQGGVGGRPIEVIVEDTEGVEATTVIAARKLITRDNVVAIIGPSRSGTSMAVIPVVQEAGVPLISVISDPTTGGTTASYAMLGDVNIAEPGALIGFAGPRVIEQTIKEKLPKGFQRSEFLLSHGMLDDVVPRKNLREYLIRIIRLFLNRPE